MPAHAEPSRPGLFAKNGQILSFSGISGRLSFVSVPKKETVKETLTLQSMWFFSFSPCVCNRRQI